MIDHFTSLLTEASSRYPGCWKRIDELRLARAGSSHPLPPHCLVRLQWAVDIVINDKNMSNIELLEQSVDIAKLTALYAWSATQRVYVFDATLLGELGATPISDVPFEIFRQLPDWCVYILIPDEFVVGCFVHMEASGGPDEELRILFDLAGGGGGGLDSLYPMVIHAFEGTVKDCLEVEMEEAERALLPVYTGNAELNEFFKRDSIIIGKIIKLLPQVVSQTLYLCSIDGDYANPPIEEKIAYQEESYESNKSQEIQVGRAIGAKLKDVMDHATNQQIHEQPQWHHYQTQEDGEPILMWRSPLLELPIISQPLQP